MYYHRPVSFFLQPDMKIQVVSTAQQCKDFDFNGKTAVVIDVLRATSVITTALSNGVHSVIPVQTVEEAERLAATLPPQSVLKGGERQAIKISGFDLSNSPLEYQEKAVKGKDIILTTTNGTIAINNAKGAEMILLACFRNMQAVADYLITRQNDIVIVCAGTEGAFSLDDGICAGMLVHCIKAKIKTDCDDLAMLLEQAYCNGAHDLFAALANCHHVQRLFSLGFYDDLRFCLTTNCVNTIPVLKEGKIIPLQ